MKIFCECGLLWVWGINIITSRLWKNLFDLYLYFMPYYTHKRQVQIYTKYIGSILAINMRYIELNMIRAAHIHTQTWTVRPIHICVERTQQPHTVAPFPF